MTNTDGAYGSENKQPSLVHSNGCDLSIIIVSYNTRELTLACLKSVYEQTVQCAFEAIVIDNASDDGSVEAVARYFPEVNLIASRENFGFARANNLATQNARGKYILLLNPDTEILNNAIDRIWRFAEEAHGHMIYGGRTVFANSELNPTSCWGSMSLWSLFCNSFGLRKLFPGNSFFNSEGIGNWRRDTIREVGVVTGCFLLITSETWRRLGGFSPHYFMYAEEADLCLRARALGARPTICPDATIIHHGSASDPVAWEKQIKVLQGKVTLMFDHWSPLHRNLGVALLKYRSLNHFVAYTILSRLFSGKGFQDRAYTYAQIWKHRHVWQQGYRTDTSLR
jgi:N-acetylglucosaminyl-diphospho-decaprenol L-rhamnosyltransferase